MNMNEHKTIHEYELKKDLRDTTEEHNIIRTKLS